MEDKRVIFVSAVSNEFHNAAHGQRHLFHSYRDVLKQAFRILAPHYEVIVQEDLVQGFGDLLETLDHEIQRSLIVVHLIGDLAGYPPEPDCIRRLSARHPGLLNGAQGLSAALGDGAGITYTQWEIYLAFHHDKRRLIFEALPDVPRSPLFAPADADKISQEAHRQRIKSTGAHRGPFHDQGDVTRKSIRSFLHFRVDPSIDPVEPTEAALAEARSHQEEIVAALAAAIKKPDPRAVPVRDPANAAAFVAAVRAAAKQWEVNLATIVSIAAQHEEEVRAAAERQPTTQALYRQALAELALGDYTAARFSARRAADLALQLRAQNPDDPTAHRESAINALLLLHEAAEAAHDIPAAIAALEEAGALVDKQTDPLFWAELHEPLAAFLLSHVKLDRADGIISEILDIREEYLGEKAPAVAKTLLLWASLLYDRAQYPGVEGICARAERIFAVHSPGDLNGIATAMNLRAMALMAMNRLRDAEPLMRRALEIAEQTFGNDHSNVASCLNNLAQLLDATNRHSEAEPLIRRALIIDEETYGVNHPNVATKLNNLACLLRDTNRSSEAEALVRRALAIDEQTFGKDHAKVAIDLSNLALLVQTTHRLTEAEPLMRRALSIDELSFGRNHPNVAKDLNNLALLLIATNHLPEAEPLMYRALAIDEECFGKDHPNVANCLHILALFFTATNRLSEAEPLMRRALAIHEQSFGKDHLQVATVLYNLVSLLVAIDRPFEGEALMRRAASIFAEFGRRNGHEHPHLRNALELYAVILKATGRTETEVQGELAAVGMGP